MTVSSAYLQHVSLFLCVSAGYCEKNPPVACRCCDVDPGLSYSVLAFKFLKCIITSKAVENASHPIMISISPKMQLLMSNSLVLKLTQALCLHGSNSTSSTAAESTGKQEDRVTHNCHEQLCAGSLQTPPCSLLCLTAGEKC